MKHVVARQSATPQVTAIEPDESLYGLFDLSTGSAETLSECDSSDPVAEVLMVDMPCSPPGFRHGGDGDGDGGSSHGHEEYRPEALTSQQRDELHGLNMDSLHTPIIGETSEVGPWRLRAWPLWQSAHIWRTFNIHLTSALDDRSPNPIDDTDNCFHLKLRYTTLRSRILQLQPV